MIIEFLLLAVKSYFEIKWPWLEFIDFTKYEKLCINY